VTVATVQLVVPDAIVLGNVVKIIPQKGRGCPRGSGSLRPRIFLTFDNTSVVDRQRNAPAAFTLGEITGTHFQSVHVSVGGTTEIFPSDIDPRIVRLVAQCFNHYATQCPVVLWYCKKYSAHKVYVKNNDLEQISIIFTIQLYILFMTKNGCVYFAVRA